MTKLPVHHLKSPTIQQLPLPFPMTELTWSAPPTSLLTLSPPHVWMSLPLAARIHVRAVLLHIFQEVIDESPRA
jgi:hypothetical protein